MNGDLDKENDLTDGDDEEDAAERKRRKQKTEKALMKVKQSKEFKKRKHEAGSDDDEAAARGMRARQQPMPGQLENCELCGKRFTVTPYSKTGPNGGLLCTKCSKELKNEEKKAEAQKRKQMALPKARRRQAESDRMMGDVKPGAKSLLDICVRRVADVVNDIDEFGDIPPRLVDRLSQILSKQRVLTSRTLNLFLRPDMDQIALYDCADLEEEDFEKIFAMMPQLQSIKLECAGQMKDPGLLYLAEKNDNLRHLNLGAPNLISNEAWIKFFRCRGAQLETLQLSYLNASLDDNTMAILVENAPNLQRIKVRRCTQITPASLIKLSQLKHLEHISLAVAQDASEHILVEFIQCLGPKLKTLRLENFTGAGDSVLAAIHAHCTRLTKLRVTGSSIMTDSAFRLLFSDWSNPALSVIDLSTNRDMDNTNPDGSEEEPIGLCSTGFQSMMMHSGSSIEKLDVHSCRHISVRAFLRVFDGEKQYPLLKEIDMSFCAYVNDIVLACVFRSCPKLKKVVVFGCFNVRHARVPVGVALIGVPNPIARLVQEGDVLDLGAL